jgi:hypothetical protein
LGLHWILMTVVVTVHGSPQILIQVRQLSAFRGIGGVPKAAEIFSIVAEHAGGASKVSRFGGATNRGNSPASHQPSSELGSGKLLVLKRSCSVTRKESARGYHHLVELFDFSRAMYSLPCFFLKTANIGCTLLLSNGGMHGYAKSTRESCFPKGAGRSNALW